VKFRCERDPLVEAISVASRGVTNRSSGRQALTGLYLRLVGDQLQVTGSDLDLTIIARAAVSGSRDGTALVPAKLLTDIVRALPEGAVTLEADENEVRIGSGRSQFAVKTIAADYPPMPEPPDNSVTIDAALLRDAITQVVSAASTDDSRKFELTGVSIAAHGDGLRLVATDTYRLAIRDLPGTSILAEGQKVLVPSAALKELGRLLSDAQTVTIRLAERHVSFEVEDVRLISQLLDGNFPEYENLLPKNADSHPNRLIIEREPFLAALRRVGLLSKETTKVRLDIKNDSVELIAESFDVGKADEVIDARHEGEELEISFNPEYLRTGIEAAPSDEITIEISRPTSPVIIRGNDSSDFLYLLMPIRN
jgi:DNA polymerase-3 subunit beta